MYLTADGKRAPYCGIYTVVTISYSGDSRWAVASPNVVISLSEMTMSDVFTAATMKNVVFWDMVTPCRACTFPSAVRYVLVADQEDSRVFHSEDAGDIFLRNIGSYKNNTALYPRRQHSWSLCTFNVARKYVRCPIDGISRYWVESSSRKPR
jgi:hypothetical protein